MKFVPMNSNCPKLDTCQKIKMVLDKDLLEFQYAEAIRAVCDKCDASTKPTEWCPQHGYPLPCNKCGEPVTKMLYHLVCEKCGGLYWSGVGFPNPQLCFKCSPAKSDEGLRETLIDDVKLTLEGVLSCSSKGEVVNTERLSLAISNRFLSLISAHNKDKADYKAGYEAGKKAGIKLVHDIQDGNLPDIQDNNLERGKE